MCRIRRSESLSGLRSWEGNYIHTSSSLLSLSGLPASSFAFSTCRVEEKGLISRLVMPWSGNYSFNSSSFIDSLNERELKSINECVPYVKNLNVKKSTNLGLLSWYSQQFHISARTNYKVLESFSPLSPLSPLSHLTCSIKSSLVRGHFIHSSHRCASHLCTWNSPCTDTYSGMVLIKSMEFMSRENMHKLGAWGESDILANPGKGPRAFILDYGDRVSEPGKK